MNIQPLQLAVKYNPPRLCLIYNNGNEQFYHDFNISKEDLTLTTEKIYHKLNLDHPGYLTQIDAGQVLKLIELIKNKQSKDSKPSRVSKLRDMVEGARMDGNIGREVNKPNSRNWAGGKGEAAGKFDFEEIDKQLENDSGSDHSIDL
ncbi:unnamed protein product [Blepharisma stoltei]|uniref:Centrosomal protein of 19 kDa n=1 Tax=Blepharisma stoltei TaxID=1481888 RepID=A0AAU9IUD8_9CILI|nr:unnamed protein product [Blepharisma stoltei]